MLNKTFSAGLIKFNENDYIFESFLIKVNWTATSYRIICVVNNFFL